MDNRLREFINSNRYWSKMKIAELSEVSPDTVYRFCKGEKKGKTVTEKMFKACVAIGFKSFDFNEFVMLAKINGYTFDVYDNMDSLIKMNGVGKNDVAFFYQKDLKRIDFIQNDTSLFHAVLSFPKSTLELKNGSLILKCFN